MTQVRLCEIVIHARGSKQLGVGRAHLTRFMAESVIEADDGPYRRATSPKSPNFRWTHFAPIGYDSPATDGGREPEVPVNGVVRLRGTAHTDADSRQADRRGREIMHWLKHAFAVEPAGAAEPTEPERAVVERLCAAIVRRRLTPAALVFLEMARPLNFLGAQVLHFFMPFLSAVTDTDGAKQFAAFLEKRGSIEYLTRRLEELETTQG